MKVSQIIVFIFLVAFCISFTSIPTQAVNVSQQVDAVPVYLSIQVRDYNTGIAVTNLSVTVGINTDWGCIVKSLIGQVRLELCKQLLETLK